MLTRSFKIGMNAGSIVAPVIHVNQYDHDEQWVFTLVDENGAVYTPTTGGIVGLKADGNVIINAGTVNSSGQVVINETQQMTAAAGDAIYEILLDNSTHGSANFIVRVEPKPGDNASMSDSDLSLLQEAIDSTNPAHIAESVQDWMDDNLAPSQWVIDNTLSISGAAADAKKTGDEITDLKSALTQFVEVRNIFDKNNALIGKTPYTSGTHYITDDNDVTTNNNYALSNVIPCNPGDTFSVNNTGSGSNIYYGDANGKYYNQGFTVGSTFTIPDGGYYFRFRLKIMGAGAFPVDDFMLVKGSSLPDHYISYGETELKSDVVIPQLDDYETKEDALTHATKAELQLETAKLNALIEQVNNLHDNSSQPIIVHIPNNTGATVENATVRLALHKSDNVANSNWNEIFSNNFSETFKDLRFYDANRENLSHAVMYAGNCDFVKDKAFSASIVTHFSDGTLIESSGYDIRKSEDSGKTWVTIQGIRGRAIFVDSADNIFFENSYKLYKADAPLYDNPVMVLDYSDTESVIYGNSIVEDDDHNMFCGLYQEAFSVKVFRMKSNETSFSLCFSNSQCQHVHCITVNRRTTPNEIYVGLDLGTNDDKSPCYRSTDGGDTFSEVDIPFRNGDYGYLCFGNGYALGGGEANIKGGPTVYRTTDINDPTKCVPVVRTLQGVRKIQNPKDNIILVYGAAGWTNKTEQCLMSLDNGLSWECIYANDTMDVNSAGAGNGIRYVTDYFTPKGDTEPQIIGTGFNMDYAMRIFLGGDRYYAICYVNVGNIPAGGKDITLETGYFVDTSSEEDTRQNIIEPVYYVRPVGGNKISTPNGEVIVENGYTNQDTFGAVKYGDLCGALQRNTIGAKYNSNSYASLGNIGLTKNTVMTVMMFLYRDTETTGNIFTSNDNSVRIDFSNGSLKLIVNNKIYYCGFTYPVNYSNSYALYAFTIEENGENVVITTYSPDMGVAYSRTVALSEWGNTDISELTFTLGNGSSTLLNGLSDILIFDRALSADEIMQAYHGRNNYAGYNVYTQ